VPRRPPHADRSPWPCRHVHERIRGRVAATAQANVTRGPARLVVAHDELDLEPGRLQLKFGGGLAATTACDRSPRRSAQRFLATAIGIGKPPSKEQGADYVLQRPTGARKLAMAEYVAAAADAIETLLDLNSRMPNNASTARD